MVKQLPTMSRYQLAEKTNGCTEGFHLGTPEQRNYGHLRADGQRFHGLYFEPSVMGNVANVPVRRIRPGNILFFNSEHSRGPDHDHTEFEFIDTAVELDAEKLKKYADSGCFLAVAFDGFTRKGYLKYDVGNDIFYIENAGAGIERVELGDGLLVSVQDRLLRPVCTGVIDLDSEDGIESDPEGLVFYGP